MINSEITSIAIAAVYGGIICAPSLTHAARALGITAIAVTPFQGLIYGALMSAVTLKIEKPLTKKFISLVSTRNKALNARIRDAFKYAIITAKFALILFATSYLAPAVALNLPSTLAICTASIIVNGAIPCLLNKLSG